MALSLIFTPTPAPAAVGTSPYKEMPENIPQKHVNADLLRTMFAALPPEPEPQVKQMPAPPDQNKIPADAAGQICPNLPHCDCSAAWQCDLYVEPEPESIAPWVGVDLDGCLAEYDGWKGVLHIGAPVAKMVQRVKTMLAQGKNVKIFTARCWADGNVKRRRESLSAIRAIEIWCEQHIGRALPVTCMKDPGMVSLFDDRAIQVEPNTGDTLEDKLFRLQNPKMFQQHVSPREG